MSDFPKDIYTEPHPIDVDTLKNLGPLTPMAGIWEGERGLDVKPKAEGPKKQAYVERIELQPIDPQTNSNYSTACAITCTSPNPIKSKCTTIKSATGCGNRPHKW